MDGIQLKEDIHKIKIRLDKVESELQTQIDQLAIKEQKWKKMDEIAEEIKQNQGEETVRFNVSGKKFQTKLITLLSTKDTLFYKMIISKEVDLKEEIFFDRNPKIFSIILDYLRNKRFEIKRYNKLILDDIRREAAYFEITPINDIFGCGPLEVEFVAMEFSGAYTVGNVIGTNNIEDLSDPNSSNKGICAVSPGWIKIELNGTWNINEIEIKGFSGNNSWSCENGAYASIKLSEDGINWNNVGTIPSGYGTTVKKVSFAATHARFIKFDSTSYLGIGFLKVKKI